MQTHEIRKRFLDHFVKAGHTEVPSASVILDDPNLLFVNAGMVQFVPYFLGQRTPPWNRATSIQKCIRTPDIDEVGHHHPAQHVLPDGRQLLVRRLLQDGRHRAGLDAADQPGRPGRLRLRSRKALGHRLSRRRRSRRTVAGDRRTAAERIQRRGMADNYWSMGIPGPCGPSSEIYYDRGPEYGVEGGPDANEDRYIEIWNLVFMQNERGEGTSQGGLRDPRAVAAQEHRHRHGRRAGGVPAAGRRQRLRDRPAAPGDRPGRGIAPRGYGQGNHDDDVRYRIIADHSRTAAIIIGDGVSPGNDGRGYVLRRLLRRVIRSAKLLGIDDTDRRRPDGHRARRDGPVVSGAGHRFRPDPAHRGGRGDRVQPHAGVGFAAVRRGRQRDEAVGRHRAVRDRRVHAARHLRLPDRTDPRDGRRSRSERRRRGLPRPDGRAASARQGRRRRPQAGARRPVRVPRTGRRRARPSSPDSTN